MPVLRSDTSCEGSYPQLSSVSKTVFTSIMIAVFTPQYNVVERRLIFIFFLANKDFHMLI